MALSNDATTLVTGCCGLLGSHLMAALAPKHRVVGVDRHPWWGDGTATVIEGDLLTPGFLADVMDRVRPHLVLHCAALTKVDLCEREPAAAAASNVDVTNDIVRSAPRGCLIVYISTDSVFAGMTPQATETEPPSPVNVYGCSKLEGERIVAQHAQEHLIIRTNFYGWSSGRKPTFAEWLCRGLDTGEPLTLFEDVYFTPIYVADLVERLLRLVADGQRGVWHLAGGERVSKYQFGCLAATVGGYAVSRIRAGSVLHATLSAPRAHDMSLSSARFQQATGWSAPSCQEGLRRFWADRARSLSARVVAVSQAPAVLMRGVV